MRIKDMKKFRRKWAEDSGEYISEELISYVGSIYEKNGKKFKGFFGVVHGGTKQNIESFLNNGINISGSYQVIYELMQNANDANDDMKECGKLIVYYNDKYLFFANNGKPFSEDNIRAICNVGQSDKYKIKNKINSGVIGKFGIGFKLTYLLLGGINQIMNYEAPIIFSWANKDEFNNFLNNSNFEPANIEHPVLFKPILTAVPIHVGEKVYNLDGDKEILFNYDEVNILKDFIKENGIYGELEKFNRGSLFFLKLSNKDDFEKNLKDQIKEIENSLIFLKYLDEVVINGKSYKKPDNIRIFPKNYELSKNIIIAYIPYSDDLKNRPNLYCYFPIADERHGLNFIIHSPNFEIETSRRSLQWDRTVNIENLQEAVDIVKNELDERKNNIEEYEELFYVILSSDKPKKEEIKKYVYDELIKYIENNIPCIGKNGEILFKNKDEVVIKNTKLNIHPKDFGIDKYWFYCKNRKVEKYIKKIIKKYTIIDIINNGNVNNINNWIKKLEEEKYLKFIDELNKNLKKDNQNLRINIRWIKFKDKYLSVDDIDKNENYIIRLSIINDEIKDILEKIGIVFSDVNFSNYKNIINAFFGQYNDTSTYLNKIYRCINNSNNINLTPKEKKILFKWLESSWKDENLTDKLRNLKLFKNKREEIKKLKELIKPNAHPEFLKDFEIDDNEYINRLDKYLCTDEGIFKTIILDNIEDIVKKSDEIGQLMDFYISLSEYFNKCNDLNLIEKLKTKKFIKTPNNDFVEPINLLITKNEIYKKIINDSKFLHLDNALNKLLGKRLPLKNILEIIIDSKYRLYNELLRDEADINYLVLDKPLNRKEIIEYLKFLSYNEVKLNQKMFCYMVYHNNNMFELKKTNGNLYYTEDKELRELAKEYLKSYIEFAIPELDDKIKENLGVIIDDNKLIGEILNKNSIKLIDYKLLFYKSSIYNKEKIIDKIASGDYIGDVYKDLDDDKFIEELWKFVKDNNIDYKLKFIEILSNHRIKLNKDFVIEILKEISKEKTLLFNKKLLIFDEGSEKYLFIKNTDKKVYLINNIHLLEVLKKYEQFVEFPIKDIVKNPMGILDEDDQNTLGNLGILYGPGKVISELINNCNVDINDMKNLSYILIKVKNPKFKNGYLKKLRELCRNNKLEFDIDDEFVKNVIKICKSVNNISILNFIFYLNGKPLKEYKLSKVNYGKLSVDVDIVPEDIKSFLTSEEINFSENDLKKLFDEKISKDEIYKKLLDVIKNNKHKDEEHKINDLAFVLDYERKSKSKQIINKIIDNAPYYAKEYSFIDDIIPEIFKSREIINEILNKLGIDEFKVGINKKEEIILSKEPIFDEYGNIYHLKENLSKNEREKLIEFLFKKSETKDKEIKRKCLKNLIDYFRYYPLDFNFNDENVKKYIKLCYDLDKLKELKETLKFKGIRINDYWVDECDKYSNLNITLNVIKKDDWIKIKDYLTKIGLGNDDIDKIFDKNKRLHDYAVYQNLIKSIGKKTFSYNDLKFIFSYESNKDSKMTILFDKIKDNAPYYIEKYSFLENIENYLPNLFKNNENNKKAFIKYIQYLKKENRELYIKNNLIISKEPKLIINELGIGEKEGILNIYHLKNNLNDNEKKELIEFLFKKYKESKNKGCKYFIIKLDNELFNFEEIFGFNPEEKIYPDKYALDEEKIPKWLSGWINEDDEKQKFLFEQFILNTKYSSMVKLRMHFLGNHENVGKEDIEKQSPEKLMNTIKWLSKNKDNDKIKYGLIDDFEDKINEIYELIKDKLLEHKSEPLFLASKKSNNKKIYDFKPLNELLWEEGFGYYFDNFGHRFWFLRGKVFEDYVENVLNCINEKLSKKTEKLLKNAGKRELSYLGYKEWKRLLLNEKNINVSIYEIGEGNLKYTITLEFNGIKETCEVSDKEYYCEYSENNNRKYIKCYVDIYDSNTVKKAIKSKTDIISDEYFDLLSEIGKRRDNNIIHKKIEEFKHKNKEKENNKIKKISVWVKKPKNDMTKQNEILTIDDKEEIDKKLENKPNNNDTLKIGLNNKMKDNLSNNGIKENKINNKESKKQKKEKKKKNKVISEEIIAPPKPNQPKNREPDTRKEEGLEWEGMAYNWLRSNISRIFPNKKVKNIRWVNEFEDSKKPYDIVVEFHNGEKYYFEVKSSEKDKSFMISVKQFEFMEKNKKTYYIIKINTKTGRIHHPINLYDALCNGTITIEYYSMKINK